ncbi:phage integrase N-terminal SAM-like domain-containing protein [Acidithiobacillus ferridurans]|uniref:phage integrase N-terminal SAM-like domain-containing protein n=1 Tax=Acidithiobacillus ferridurans TaxID=1232575 RepID=UPI001D01F9E9|nr:phage integrase N-terminal SAM-like domain-containing protein [Acidithiobacillus ferridurans]
MRLRHYSLRTEQAYAYWVKRFVLFHRKRHPREMGAAEVESLLLGQGFPTPPITAVQR